VQAVVGSVKITAKFALELVGGVREAVDGVKGCMDMGPYVENFAVNSFEFSVWRSKGQNR